MAVVKMNKFTLLTFGYYKDQLLKELQIFENVQFKDLQDGELHREHMEFLKKDASKDNVSYCESQLAKIKFVQEKIRPHVVKPTGLKAMAIAPDTLTFEAFDTFVDSYNFGDTYDQVKAIDESLKVVKLEKTKLKTDIENLTSWQKLDISTLELDKLRQVKYFLGTLNKTTAGEVSAALGKDFPCVYVEDFGKIKDETNLLVIAPVEQAEEVFALIKGMGFTKSNVNLSGLPKEQIALNEKQITKLEEKEAKLNCDTAVFSAQHGKLDVVLDYFKTSLERAKVCDNFLTLEQVVVIEGWVPCEEFAKLERIVTASCGNEYFIECAEVDRDCTEVPIQLKNNKLVTAFEGITSMYALPRYNENDPTALFTPFYIAFFGIMIGDVGYGLVLLLMSLFALKKLHLGKGTKDFMTFLFYLSFSVIAFGFMYGGIFGIAFFTPLSYTNSAGVVIKKAILDSSVDIVPMIIYSVIIGIFHVLFGVAIKGYNLIKEGKPLDALFDSVFWIICILSGIGFLVGATGIIPPVAASICKWAFFGSLVGLTLTQGRENASIGTKLAGGLFGVYGITSYVGDIVSYTRLVALALSGAYIAMSFNIMAGLMPNIFLKIIFGTLIFVAGQTLNLGLAVLGAYVHTCRLQYVEFFGKFYEGGGKPFKPFKLMNESIKINKN